jgi:CubicO group peptidase (beta-lactamase class C family)
MLKRILLIALLIGAVIFAFTFNSCLTGRFVVWNFSDIGDYEKFPSKPLKASATPFRFIKGKEQLHEVPWEGKKQNLISILEANDSRAFLIIRNDSILFERYFEGYSDSSIVPTFSMAKSFVSALFGCAIADGLIRSTSDKVSDYVPEMKANGWDKVTIEHVLDMSSGVDFKESYYSPLSEAASFYYGFNLREQTMKLKLKRQPGTEYEYISGNTQVLGLILERVLKGKSLTAYLQEKIWTPLQMEFDASWSIDDTKTGMEKAFCCINARARDYAKFGRLYLDSGRWNGTQVVPQDWVTASTQVSHEPGTAAHYHRQWWLRPNGSFMARGHLGQYIYVNRAKKLILVRLGAGRGDFQDWPTLLDAVAATY